MEPNVNVDFIGNSGQAQGEIASRFGANGRLDPGSMRPFINDRDGRTYVTVYKGGDPKNPKSYKSTPISTYGTLRRDEWKQLDDAVLGIAENRLNGINDLINAGLTFNLGNAMGTTVLEWHDVSDALEATLTMDGVTRAQGDRPVYTTNYLPLPIIHADYEINRRVLAASRNMGNPIDTTLAERASRKVNEKLESMLFTNVTYAFGGGTIYSYLNHTARNTTGFQTNGAWDASAKTAADILEDVRHIKQTMINNFFYGPYVIYIPTTYETVLDEDYDATTPGTTIRDRILKVQNITDVRVVDTLPDANVIGVQLTSDVVRLVRGMGIQNVEWMTEGNMITKYKVMTIQVPQIRADQNGNTGLVHMS